jgi:hypothetical protein
LACDLQVKKLRWAGVGVKDEIENAKNENWIALQPGWQDWENFRLHIGPLFTLSSFLKMEEVAKTIELPSSKAKVINLF